MDKTLLLFYNFHHLVKNKFYRIVYLHSPPEPLAFLLNSTYTYSHCNHELQMGVLFDMIVYIPTASSYLLRFK